LNSGVKNDNFCPVKDKEINGVLSMSWYSIFMIVGITLVGGGWIAYLVYNHIMDKREKQQPRKSQQLQKANESMVEYAQKLAKFKKKSYLKEPDDKQ